MHSGTMICSQTQMERILNFNEENLRDLYAKGELNSDKWDLSFVGLNGLYHIVLEEELEREARAEKAVAPIGNLTELPNHSNKALNLYK